MGIPQRTGTSLSWLRHLHDSSGLTLQKILRKDFLFRQKEWELDQARSAPEAPEALEDDEREAVSNSMEGKNTAGSQVSFS